MSEPKPFASLSSGLLARKGAAKPAMRPQGFGQMGTTGMEDLGWNDMGYGAPPPEPFAAFDEEPREHVPSSIAALTPAPRLQEKVADAEIGEADETEEIEAAEVAETTEDAEEIVAEPSVIEQQRALADSFAARPEIARVGANGEDKSAAVVPLPRRPRKAPGSKGKAAFTLRLDPERHLKLRLACAIRHRSAQQIVSEALDTFLKTLPELESLAEQLPAKAAKSN